MNRDLPWALSPSIGHGTKLGHSMAEMKPKISFRIYISYKLMFIYLFIYIFIFINIIYYYINDLQKTCRIVFSMGHGTCVFFVGTLFVS